MKVFYSWQSDSPNNTNRAFIRRALAESVKKVADDLDVDDADRPDVDEATKNTQGMVDITASILRKISECAVYVADVTPVAHLGRRRKALPNPNVMYELGWASHKPGYDHIIAVMNTYKNRGPDALPFDLRGRLVLTYSLAPNAADEDRQKVRKALSSALEGAIKTNLKTVVEVRNAEKPIHRHPSDERDVSIWAGENSSLTIPSAIRGQEHVAIVHGPRSFIRVTPASWPNGPIPSALDLEGYQPRLWAPPVGTGGSYGPCELGFVNFWYETFRDDLGTTSSVALYLEEFGEFWILDGTTTYTNKNGTWVQPQRVLKIWSQYIREINQMLDNLGGSKRRLIEVGVTNMKDGKYYLNDSRILHARKASVLHNDQRPSWSSEEQQTFLLQAYNKLLLAFSCPRVTADEITRITK